MAPTIRMGPGQGLSPATRETRLNLLDKLAASLSSRFPQLWVEGVDIILLC